MLQIHVDIIDSNFHPCMIMQDFIFSMKFSLCHVQDLFLEPRKIEKLEENVFEVNW